MSRTRIVLAGKNVFTRLIHGNTCRQHLSPLTNSAQIRTNITLLSSRYPGHGLPSFAALERLYLSPVLIGDIIRNRNILQCPFLVVGKPLHKESLELEGRLESMLCFWGHAVVAISFNTDISSCSVLSQFLQLQCWRLALVEMLAKSDSMWSVSQF